MREKSRLKILICLLTFVGFLAQGEARTVNVAVPTLNMVVIAFTAAKEKGYYQEEGLEVEIIWMSAPVAAQALIGGNVEFSTVSGAALPAILRGAPLRFLFTTYNRPMFWLYAKPEISDIKGLRGKKVAVSGIGSGPAHLLIEILKKHGLEGGRDVALLGLGVQPNQYAALLSGSVDAAMMAPPYNVMLKEAGFYELVSFLKEDFVELQGSIIIRQELLRSDPALVERFVRGTLKGFRYARENRSGTIPILVRYQKLREELAAKYYDLVRPIMTLDGTASEELQKKFLDFGTVRLGLKESPPLQRVFDYSLTRRINGQLEAAGWKPEK